MVLLKNVDVYSLPMCALLIFGFHAAAGQLVRVKLEKDTHRGDQVCQQDTECVSGYEFCDINLEPESTQKCGSGNELSKSFCCPVDKVIRSKRDKRMIDDDDKSKLDNILSRSATIKPLPEEPECGLNTKSSSNTSDVQNSKANHWPWMAVLLRTIDYTNYCGGTLLNQRFVLTAAHCFKMYNEKDSVVRLGEYDFNTPNETQKVDFKMSAIRMHPEYELSTHANDIALVRLSRPAIYSSIIRPICLPKTNMEVYNRNAVVAGWGRLGYDREQSRVLLEVEVPIWEHDKCVAAFPQPISKTNLCAAGYDGGEDSCLGDSGGPLLLQRQDGRWTNIGVVSWGVQCGLVNNPGVYTKVTSYLKWIAVNTQDVI